MITKIKINEDAKKRYYRAGYWTSDTIDDAWARAVKAHPDALYVKDDQGLQLTYRQCDNMAMRIATWLMRVGVQRGDVVTFQVPTWAEFCPVFLGISKAGAVMHPVARNYSVSDLAFVMNKARSAAFICPTVHHGTNHEQQAIDCLDQVESLKRGRILLIDKKSNGKHYDDLTTLGEVLDHFKPAANLPAASSDDVACILSTSGTTDKPKQVMLTHNNILFSERAFTAGLALDENDIMFMPSPLNHATGFFHGLVSPFILGGTVILQQDFDADCAVDLINREHATWSMGATPFVYDILNSLECNGTEIPSLNLFLSGGAPLPSVLVEIAAKHDVTLCECYGSTESCPHAYVPPAKCREWNGAWSGTALRGIEIRIVDEQRREVPRGVQGEEASRGPCVFVGYLGEDARADCALDTDGWFYSGDLGIMDDWGRLRINARKKEIVIRGGENISAREVDNAVEGWPDIVDHATIGAPDERMGERICLFAVPAADLDHGLRLADLIAYLREKGVSKRLWPERIEAITAVPRTESGKVRCHELSQILSKRMAPMTNIQRTRREVLKA